MKKEESARTEIGNARNHTHEHYITLPNPYQLSDSMILAQLEEFRDWIREASERIGLSIEIAAKADGYARVCVDSFKHDENHEVVGNYAYIEATRYKDGHVGHCITKNINGEPEWEVFAPDMGFTFEVIDV